MENVISECRRYFQRSDGNTRPTSEERRGRCNHIQDESRSIEQENELFGTLLVHGKKVIWAKTSGTAAFGFRLHSVK
jgi:hypothetical protein